MKIEYPRPQVTRVSCSNLVWANTVESKSAVSTVHERNGREIVHSVHEESLICFTKREFCGRRIFPGLFVNKKSREWSVNISCVI